MARCEVCIYLFRSIAAKALALTPNLEVVPTLPVARSTEVWCERGIVQTQRSYTNGPSSQRHPYHWPLRINKLKSKLHWLGINEINLQTIESWRNVADNHPISSGCRWGPQEGIGSRQLEGGLVERTQTGFVFLKQIFSFSETISFFIWKMGIIIP